MFSDGVGCEPQQDSLPPSSSSPGWLGGRSDHPSWLEGRSVHSTQVRYVPKDESYRSPLKFLAASFLSHTRPTALPPVERSPFLSNQPASNIRSRSTAALSANPHGASSEPPLVSAAPAPPQNAGPNSRPSSTCHRAPGGVLFPSPGDAVDDSRLIELALDLHRPNRPSCSSPLSASSSAASCPSGWFTFETLHAADPCYADRLSDVEEEDRAALALARPPGRPPRPAPQERRFAGLASLQSTWSGPRRPPPARRPPRAPHPSRRRALRAAPTALPAHRCRRPALVLCWQTPGECQHA
jgi:hypothetical protein